jgi:electron transport complex protein RnfB
MGNDLYDDLCSFYEFIMGPLPGREELKDVLRETVSGEELALFFRIPTLGAIAHAKLAKKAGLPAENLAATLKRLASEGLILAYTRDGETVYERGNPVFMTEQQVRKPEDTPRRYFYARFFNSILNGEVTVAAPTKTPYYRVLPLEVTVTGEPGEGAKCVIPVNADIPDQRGVLPVDIVSEMIRRDARLIGVADCYCRRTKELLGEGCGKPLQTCLVFNRGAETLIEHGTARRIGVEEALEIVHMSAELGLVHNVDNVEGEIGSLCNCCPCCSVLLTTWRRGITNADSPSRYRVVLAAERCQLCQGCVEVCPTGARAVTDGRMTVDDLLCLGCGLCVTACPQGANSMVLRPGQARMPPTLDALESRIRREAVIGMVKQRLTGLFRRL